MCFIQWATMTMDRWVAGSQWLSLWFTAYKVSAIITHRLIFARAHWTKEITWYKIGRRASGDTRRPTWNPSSDFIDKRKTRKYVFFFFHVLTFQIFDKLITNTMAIQKQRIQKRKAGRPLKRYASQIQWSPDTLDSQFTSLDLLYYKLVLLCSLAQFLTILFKSYFRK